MFLSLQSLWRSTIFSDCTRYWKGSKEEETRQDAQIIQSTKTVSTVETWNCERWSLYKADPLAKNHLQEQVRNQRLLSEERLLQEFPMESCEFDIENSEHLKDYFSNFLPILKNTVVIRTYSNNLMRDYAEKVGNLYQARKIYPASL